MITDPQKDYEHGWVPFLGVDVCLESRPLIPRTETEYWVERAITEILDVRHQVLTTDVGHPQFRILDLFAGSGAIGLAVLKHIPNAHVTFAEKEARHFPTIRKSIVENGIDPARALLVKTDVWSPILDVGHQVLRAGDVVGHQVLWVFEYVLANPPYVSRERDTVSPEALSHEPHEALYADDDGFALIKRTVLGLPEHLAPDGAAWIEHEPFHTDRLKECTRENGFEAATEQDQYGVERFTHISKNTVA